MLPNAETDIVPLDSLWGCSRKMMWDIISGDTAGNAFPVGLFLFAALTGILVLSLRFPSAVSDFITRFPRPLPQSRTFSLPVALLFLLTAVSCSFLTAAFICYLSALPVSRLWFCTAVILAAVAAKTIILSLISEASGQPCFLSFIRALLFLLAAICFITMAASLAILLFHAAIAADYILIGLIFLTVLVYICKISLTLFSAGIPPFYTFLYLCTLEILPICHAVSLCSRL